ncbi:MAG: hypothetical protein IJ572_04595 [Bacilli bacterium]|nr:hypothetical protein [Bacilli bacterium]
MLILFDFRDIFAPILQVIDTLFIYINTLIYDFISFLYQIFIALSSAQIFTSDQYQVIADRIYIVIGVITLFLISYALLRAIINPDESGKGEYSLGKIVPNVIKVIVLIAFVPTIFRMAYNMQEAIMGTDVIQKIVLGDSFSTDGDDYDYKGTSTTSDGNTDYQNFKFNYKKAGRTMANDIFLSFLYPTDELVKELSGGSNTIEARSQAEQQIQQNSCFFPPCADDSSSTAYTFAQAHGDVDTGAKNFTVYANFGEKIHGSDKQLEYNGLFQLIAGIIVIYVFANYCIDIGVRAVKLGYFQLIAPFPILTILVPGQKKIFDNWLKATLATYADVFVRVLGLMFGMLLIQMLPNVGDTLWANSIFEGSTSIQFFARVFIIIGILIFLKQAPKLITDLTGLKMPKFGIKDRLTEAFDFSKVPVLGRAEGALTGALGGGLSSKMNGGSFRRGARYGMANGLKEKGLQFNNQREKAYSTLGFKGKPGVFGGQNWIDKHADDMKNEYSDYYKDHILPVWINKEENSARWNEIKNEKMDAARETINKQYQSRISEVEAQRDNDKKLYNSNEQVEKRRNAFYEDIKKQVDGLNEELRTGRVKFEEERKASMDALKSRVGIDKTATDEYLRYRDLKWEDSYDYSRINDQIKEISGRKFVDQAFDESPYTTQINNLRAENYAALNDETEEIEVFNEATQKFESKKISKLESEAIKATRKQYRDEDETYDNRYDVYARRRREAENKAFKNSPLGQQWQAVVDAMSAKNDAGGAKPSGDGSKKPSDGSDKK